MRANRLSGILDQIVKVILAKGDKEMQVFMLKMVSGMLATSMRVQNGESDWC